MKEAKLAVIRIRGKTGVKRPIADTMAMLHLDSKNKMVVLPSTPEFQGMIKKIKDFTTYGEVSDEVLKELSGKRKNLTPDSKIMSFTLAPPIGGFERKGTKVTFSKKGALGYRADKINDLIKRMM